MAAPAGLERGARSSGCWFVEVPNQFDAAFARRMYTYDYRLFDRHDRKVASLAVLGDTRPGWRPDKFGYELLGCQVRFRFPIAKLLDYRRRWATLEGSDNPFATAVMAHLKALETHADAGERQRWKFSLVRRLYDRGYSKDDVVNLYRFIDGYLSSQPSWKSSSSSGSDATKRKSRCHT